MFECRCWNAYNLLNFAILTCETSSDAITIYICIYFLILQIKSNNFMYCVFLILRLQWRVKCTSFVSINSVPLLSTYLYKGIDKHEALHTHYFQTWIDQFKKAFFKHQRRIKLVQRWLNSSCYFTCNTQLRTSSNI